MKSGDTKRITKRRDGRSPCGERGLKSRGCAKKPANRQSLPVRGAWIEISDADGNAKVSAVAPRAGSVD